jgi:hypothetical protein
MHLTKILLVPNRVGEAARYAVSCLVWTSSCLTLCEKEKRRMTETCACQPIVYSLRHSTRPDQTCGELKGGLSTLSTATGGQLGCNQLAISASTVPSSSLVPDFQVYPAWGLLTYKPLADPFRSQLLAHKMSTTRSTVFVYSIPADNDFRVVGWFFFGGGDCQGMNLLGSLCFSFTIS